MLQARRGARHSVASERFVTKFPATRYVTPCSGKGPPGSHGQAQLLRSSFLRAVERHEPIDLLGRVIHSAVRRVRRDRAERGVMTAGSTAD